MNLKVGLESIRLEPLRKINIDEHQWVKVYVNVKLNGFTASYNVSIELESFTSFLETLRSCSIDRTQEIFFTTLEDSITLSGKYIDSEMVQWNGKLQYPVGIGSILNFNMETDTAQIENLINELEFELNNL
jgi:hypothetical protein